MKEIIFCRYTPIEVNAPIPAKNFLPSWYKETNAYVNKPNDFFVSDTGSISNRATIKKCIPVFDALTVGYLLVTASDIYIKNENGFPFYYWAEYTKVRFHPAEQVKLHPFVKQEEQWVAKIQHDWGIKTPPGYSALIIPPMHRENIITIMPGLVDTDKYNLPVEFPFILTKPTFEGMLPANTPIAQVIPIKRESWNHNIKEVSEVKKNNSLYKLKNTFVNSYKKNFWSKKEYK